MELWVQEKSYDAEFEELVAHLQKVHSFTLAPSGGDSRLWVGDLKGFSCKSFFTHLVERECVLSLSLFNLFGRRLFLTELKFLRGLFFWEKVALVAGCKRETLS